MIGNIPTSARMFRSKVSEVQFYMKPFEVHSHLCKWLMEITEHLKLVKNLIQGLPFSAFWIRLTCNELSWNKGHSFSISVLLHYWLVGIWNGQTKSNGIFLFLHSLKWFCIFYGFSLSELSCCLCSLSWYSYYREEGKNLALPIRLLIGVKEQLSNFYWFSLKWHIGANADMESS